jgi:thymidine kinase
MFSGKTTKLLELYSNYKHIPVAVINHSFDKRYDETMLSTHDRKMIPCIQASKLMDMWPSIKESDVILINEGQFFDDLYEGVEHMLNHKKRVYVAGLDGDFKRKRIGQILDLVPLCDKVTKLNSICRFCENGKPAIFSKRLSRETEQTVIGSDNYIPLCRECYERV